MNHRLILLTAFLLSICTLAGAQEFSDSVLINFRQSKVNLDPAYMSNSESLDEIGRKIEVYTNPDSAFVLRRVTVVGGASPEGSVRFNEWLSRERAARIFDYLSASVNLPDSITSFTFLGRDWGGLKAMVTLDENVPYRAEVLALLDDIIANSAGGEKESAGNLLRLKRLRGGEPYLYMYHKLFPTLRASRLRLDYTRRLPAPVAPDTVYMAESLIPDCIPDTIVVHDTIYIDRIVYMAPPCKPFYMNLRTNMIYDALAVPNIGVEFYLGKNFSIDANWMYGWWKTDRRHRYWRAYGGDIALRWYFGSKAHEKPLQGHHVGVYGGLLTYDFEWGGKGYMGGVPGGTLWDRCHHVAGVEYGYSLPVAKRLNIDFTIGIGYMGGEYRTYNPIDNHYVWESTRYRRWFGPTKAEISLVWQIGCDNVNLKKGGRR